MHHPFQRTITKLRINISFHDYPPFILVHIRCNPRKCTKNLTCFFEHIAYMTFECKLIISSNTQKFLLQNASNFDTVDIDVKVISGYSC